MFLTKCGSFLILVVCCSVALSASSPHTYHKDWQPDSEELLEVLPLARRARSPEGGSVVLTASKDSPMGREARVQYNHNLYSTGDGRGSIDAYAQASRNFDFNRNDFGGGIRGTWRF
ncbi:uncharacterized protein LOC6546321 [Drosophila erecta]|uniref:Attacin C-terminal domain-containing protein n=1 Tax=Drosophila erecta TaxID=7220 RepID=B3NHU4_DROER|nr:uncharacterized protein LOC6546321 [Drosophila erecta]EDV51959.1 uncharacterized protein Dere_GG13620 [Drosophila erecta]